MYVIAEGDNTVMPADMDGDGAVINLDSGIVARNLARWDNYEGNEYNYANADVDRDGNGYQYRRSNNRTPFGKLERL